MYVLVICNKRNDSEGKIKRVSGWVNNLPTADRMWYPEVGPLQDLKEGYTRTSQQRTGTPPYIAQDLLRGTSPIHLYRHDLESLFYVMLLTCWPNTLLPVVSKTEQPQRFVMRQTTNLPYQRWFREHNYDTLGEVKKIFLLDMKAIELSKPFEDFRPWLNALKYQFTRGFIAKSTYLIEQDRVESNGPSVGEVNRFDEETLGGHIRYASFIEPVHRLTGGLAGLIIRYNPPQSPISASGGATHPNT